MLEKRFIVKTAGKACDENTVYYLNYRITVLTDRLFRIENSKNGKFRDSATQSVWFRNTPPVKFVLSEDNDVCEIKTEKCALLIRPERDECRVIIGDNAVSIDNEGNLLGTTRTLDNCNGDLRMEDWRPMAKPAGKVELGFGVCSKKGVAVIDDSASLTLGEDGKIKSERADGTDEYVFCYGTDYAEAVKALYIITGKPPMLPRFTLGNWWSRYYPYTDREYLALLEKFREENVPLTVATVDMDWHYCNDIDETFGVTEKGRNSEFYGGTNGWTGYCWNKTLFPDHCEFLKEVKKFGLKITLNLHPADGVRWWDDNYAEFARRMGIDPETAQKIPFDIASDEFINGYFDTIIRPYEKEGVDFWWIDWQQGTTSSIEGLDPLWSLNHYHYIDNAVTENPPVILSRYAGIGSHRYPIGFSGDTHVTYDTLSYLPYFTATATNAGYTWWSHDIGGHMNGETNGEMYVRHVQFGVFSPINRLHCSNAKTVTKEPWFYLGGAGEIAERFLRFRHSLIPYLYTANYKTATSGDALIRPLYYEHPESKKAYEYKNEYYFGDLIVAPITAPREKDGFSRVKVWLPEGKFTDIFTGDEYVVKEGGEERTLNRTLDYIPVLAKAGTILPLSADSGNSFRNPQNLLVKVYSGTGEYVLYEDGDGEYYTRFKVCEENGKTVLTIAGSGNERAIPENRRVTVTFCGIRKGEIRVYSRGDKLAVKPDYKEELSVTFDYDPNAEYTVTAIDSESETEKLISRSARVLCSAEENVYIKQCAYTEIEKAKTPEEYAITVEKSELPDIIKARLTETLKKGND